MVLGTRGSKLCGCGLIKTGLNLGDQSQRNTVDLRYNVLFHGVFYVCERDHLLFTESAVAFLYIHTLELVTKGATNSPFKGHLKVANIYGYSFSGARSKQQRRSHKQKVNIGGDIMYLCCLLNKIVLLKRYP